MNAMDFDAITEVFDPKLVHTTLPSSLQRPVVNYDQYFRYLDSITDMFVDWNVSYSFKAHGDTSNNRIGYRLIILPNR